MSAVILPFERSAPASGSAPRSLLAEAAEVCRRAAAGDLEARVVDIHDAPPEVEVMCHELNHLLDQTDAFIREAAASLDHVAHDKFHRRLLERGLLGSFRRDANIINDATAAMGERSKELSALKAHQRKLADELEGKVQSMAQVLAGAATELVASAQELTRTMPTMLPAAVFMPSIMRSASVTPATALSAMRREPFACSTI